MKKLLIFNFKNRPSGISQAKEIFDVFQNNLKNLSKNYKCVIIPSFLHLPLANQFLGRLYSLGSQDIFWLNRVAATGEISPVMLKDFKAEYVIVGHSERRTLIQETDKIINYKIKACLGSSLIPILCVGEKEKNLKSLASNFNVKNSIFEQLNYAFRGILINKNNRLIVAYEPVWAIGKSETLNPETIKEVINLIRFWLQRRFTEKLAKNINVIYGGSVKNNNINSVLSLKNVDGVLIGGASVNKSELLKMIKKLKK